MNDDYSTSKDPFLPVLILVISYLVLVGWQFSNIVTQRGLMEDASARQTQLVTQSHQAQTALQKLASDILEAAKTDDTAKAIVQKYGMQMNAAASSAATPAP